MKFDVIRHAVLPVALVASGIAAHAADWSDTSISYRYGSRFAEPYEGNDISKNIINFTHGSASKYGANFLSVDLLMSDDKDPDYAGSSNGAQEIYLVYRYTLDLGSVTGKTLAFGPAKDMGITAGFDVNDKNDAGYNSKKRMLVLGPTFMMNVPGFMNVSLLELWESNAPYDTYTHTGVARYSYEPHPMLSAAWGIPIGSSGFSFEGFANLIAPKGHDEFGNRTKTETNIDMQVMYDLSNAVGAGKGTFKLGPEFQYWRNKFGNDADGPAGSGAFAKTPMVRVEYHF